MHLLSALPSFPTRLHALASVLVGTAVMVGAHAQTLQPGDVALVGYNADTPDAIAIVALTDLPAGATLSFTDNGWLAGGGFRANEGTATYTIPAGGLAAGTVVTPDLGAIALSSSGDQLLVYQGDAASPTFLYGLQNNGTAWDADATSSNTSALPPGLTEGTTALALPETDNAAYAGPTSGTRAELLAAIADPASWTSSDSERQPFPAGPFTIGSGGGGGSLVDPLISEFLASHTGTDDREFIEVVGQPGTDYGAFTVLVVDGSSTNGPGVIYGAYPVGATNAEGYWTTGFLTNALVNNTLTLLLVEGFSGTVGDDLDADDDGTRDASPWAQLVDGVAAVEAVGEPTYAAPVLGPDGAFFPAGASRLPGSIDTDSADDWAFNDFNLAGISGDDPADGYAYNTPGAPNAVFSVPAPDLVINEILADPAPDAAGDANGDGTRDASADEFIEILNPAGGPIDLSGWTLSDGAQVRHTFPAGSVVEGQCALVVFGGGAPASTIGSVPVQTASAGGLGLNNGGDTVTLADASGRTIATVTYGSEAGSDQSITRDPDGTGGFVQHTQASGAGNALFSPGTQVGGTPFAGCAPPIDECASTQVEARTIFPNLTGQALIDALAAAYRPDPAQMPPTYAAARDYLYAFIDNENGVVEGVYTGFTATGVPQDLATARDAAQSQGINAEHIWPQSRGIGDDEPGARTNLHHLFPSRSQVNSARSNSPYAALDDDTQTDIWYIDATSTQTKPTANIDGYSELDNQFGVNSGDDLPFDERRFEPREQFQGDAARATFYVAAIYSALVQGEQGFLDAQKATLRAWAAADPPTQAEYERSCAVAVIQDGAVNPFVHDPTLIDRAFFDAVTVSGTARTPLVPTADEPTTVTASVVSPNAGLSVELAYTVNGGPEQTVAAANTSGDTYAAAIPASAYGDGDRVEYVVRATDSEGTAEGMRQGFFAGTTPIAALEGLEDADGVLEVPGFAVRVEGTATVEAGTFSDSSLDVYLQDATGGIGLFRGGDTTTPFVRGRAYAVEGTLTQFNGKVQIAAGPITDLGDGAPVTPTTVTIDALLATPDDFESDLVRIEGVSITGGDFPEAGTSSSVTISDGTGTLDLRIDGDTGIAPTDRPQDPFTAVGIFTQFDETLPYTEGYQLQPRDAADLVGTTTTLVRFASDAATVDEEAGTYTLTVEIVNPSPTAATTVDLAATGGTASGADYAFTDATLTFPAGSADPQTATVTLVDDGDPEPAETVTFELQNAAGGDAAAVGSPGTFTLTIDASDVPTGNALLLEDFEDAAVSYTLSTPAFTDGFGDYFTRTDGSDIAATFTNVQGGAFFAAQDVDGEGAAATQTLTFSGIDIRGYDELQFIGFFAEDDAGDGNEDWDTDDFVHVDVQIDGGGFVPVFWIENDGATFNTAPRVDDDFDGVGEGVEITDAFAEFQRAIAGNGETLDLRITVSLDSGDEDIAFDEIRVTGISLGGLPVELASFTATADGADAVLAWQTASESGNAGFEVQQALAAASGEADAWTVLDFVEGAGTTAEPRAYRYVVPDLAPGTYRFRLRQVDADGGSVYSPEVTLAVALPGAFRVTAPYPNPFNPQATFEVSVAQAQRVRIALHDLLGREVAVLYDGAMSAGTTERVRIDGGALSSGAYLVRVTGEAFAATRRVMLIK